MKDFYHKILTTLRHIFGIKKPKKKRCISRKKSDTTRFTQRHFDYILWRYRTFRDYNENGKNTLGFAKQTVLELIVEMNTVMGTDKSRTAISRVWQGKIDRSTLATGSTNDFDWK